MQDQKKELRSRYLKLRKGLSRESVENRSYRVMANIKGLVRPSDRVFLFYVPINNEVDLLPLVKDIYLKGKAVLFPKVVGPREIEPWIIDDLYEDFKPGAYNIPEPDTRPYEGPIDIVFVPGICFDRDGNRVGYGKSFYDNFLSRRKVGRTIGVCYDFQLLDAVPHTSSDRPLDCLAWDSGAIEIRKGG